jgi:hypothetical protein
MERLQIAREDGYLRVTKGSGVIQSAALDDGHTGRPWRSTHQMRSTFAAEFARDGIR